MERWRVSTPPASDGGSETPQGGATANACGRWPRIPQLESSFAMDWSEQDHQHTQGRAPDSGEEGEAPGRDDRRQENAFDVVPIPRASRPQRGHETAGAPRAESPRTHQLAGPRLPPPHVDGPHQSRSEDAGSSVQQAAVPSSVFTYPSAMLRPKGSHNARLPSSIAARQERVRGDAPLTSINELGDLNAEEPGVMAGSLERALAENYRRDFWRFGQRAAGEGAFVRRQTHVEGRLGNLLGNAERRDHAETVEAVMRHRDDGGNGGSGHAGDHQQPRVVHSSASIPRDRPPTTLEASESATGGVVAKLFHLLRSASGRGDFWRSRKESRAGGRRPKLERHAKSADAFTSQALTNTDSAPGWGRERGAAARVFGGAEGSSQLRAFRRERDDGPRASNMASATDARALDDNPQRTATDRELSAAAPAALETLTRDSLIGYHDLVDQPRDDSAFAREDPRNKTAFLRSTDDLLLPPPSSPPVSSMAEEAASSQLPASASVATSEHEPLLTVARRPPPTGLDSRKPLTTFFPAVHSVGDVERFVTGTGTSRAAEEHDGLRVWWREGPGLDPIAEKESRASERLCGRDTTAGTCGSLCRRFLYLGLAAGACVACFVYGNARNGVTDEPIESKTAEWSSPADTTGGVPTVGCCDCCGDNTICWTSLTAVVVGGGASATTAWLEKKDATRKMRRLEEAKGVLVQSLRGRTEALAMEREETNQRLAEANDDLSAAQQLQEATDALAQQRSEKIQRLEKEYEELDVARRKIASEKKREMEGAREREAALAGSLAAAQKRVAELQKAEGNAKDARDAALQVGRQLREKADVIARQTSEKVQRLEKKHKELDTARSKIASEKKREMEGAREREDALAGSLAAAQKRVAELQKAEGNAKDARDVALQVGRQLREKADVIARQTSEKVQRLEKEHKELDMARRKIASEKQREMEVARKREAALVGDLAAARKRAAELQKAERKVEDARDAALQVNRQLRDEAAEVAEKTRTKMRGLEHAKSMELEAARAARAERDALKTDKAQLEDARDAALQVNRQLRDEAAEVAEKTRKKVRGLEDAKSTELQAARAARAERDALKNDKVQLEAARDEAVKEAQKRKREILSLESKLSQLHCSLLNLLQWPSGGRISPKSLTLFADSYFSLFGEELDSIKECLRPSDPESLGSE